MLELKVDGMTCGGCAKSVMKAVDRVEPGVVVEVDLAAKTVRIASDRPAAAFAEAIEAAGYDVAA